MENPKSARLRILLAAHCLCGFSFLASPALAQNAENDAVGEADDAFGTSVGQERSGIYSDLNTRGFSPLDAGNVRLDGVYFDQVAVPASKLRRSTSIRVGFGAVDTPFVAPTGIVDNQLKPFPDKAGGSVQIHRFYYGGHLLDAEFRLPLNDHVAIMGGPAKAYIGLANGADSESWGMTLRAIVRLGDFEISPFFQGGQFPRDDVKPLTIVSDGYIPDVPPSRRFLGQTWARGAKIHRNVGTTVKGKITDTLSLRGGYFESAGDEKSNFSEFFVVKEAGGLSSHTVIADPAHRISSNSGEALFVLRLGDQHLSHRLFAGYRSRDRVTETGGSDVFSLGNVVHGDIDRIAKPQFDFSSPDFGRVRQSSWMAAYVGALEGVGHLNIGVQKARYRASLREGDTGFVNRSKADPWLYNASLMVELTSKLSVFAATQRGLEDSGIAPGNAANRNAQLPATKSTQYEGGVRWDFGKGQLVLAGFQITKPYFALDADRNFVALGQRRHRGIEISLNSHFTDRFDLLVGAVAMDPQVSGEGRDSGLLGPRPADTPKLFGQIDANYRTDLWGNLTLTGSLKYKSNRAVTSRPIEHLGGKQASIPSEIKVDLGTRQVFDVGDTKVGLRLIWRNVFDNASWYIGAPDVIFPDLRRSFMAILSVDF